MLEEDAATIDDDAAGEKVTQARCRPSLPSENETRQDKILQEDRDPRGDKIRVWPDF